MHLLQIPSWLKTGFNMFARFHGPSPRYFRLKNAPVVLDIFADLPVDLGSEYHDNPSVVCIDAAITSRSLVCSSWSETFRRRMQTRHFVK
jgi:hypothetical protein